MTAESRGADSPEPWLLDTYRNVQRAIREATNASELAASLPAAMAEMVEHRLAWLGEVQEGTEHLRIRYAAGSTPSTTDVDIELESPPGDWPAVQCLESGNVVTAPADRAEPEHRHLRNEFDPDYLNLANVDLAGVAGSVSIPLVTDSSPSDGDDDQESEPEHRAVLAIYTTASVADPLVGEVFDDIALSIDAGFAALETGRELDRARRRLEALRSSVSHDFNNPLNLASGRLELASDDCESSHLDDAHDALEELDHLVERNLRYVRAGYPVEEAETCSLDTIARESWDDLRDEMGDREATLDVGDEIPLRGDSERIRLLLLELFRNAVVHSEGEIRVTVGALGANEGFYVADSGPGIPESEREYVLDRGYSTEPEMDGSGLALVDEICGAHGWEYRLTDSADDGTRVEILTSTW